MKPEPRIAFCTTCKGRTQHLAETLPRNLADNVDYRNCVFVVLDYGDPGELRAFLEAHLPAHRLVAYRFENGGPFRMAHAKNMAHRLGMIEGSDILVNIDADNFTGPGFASYIAQQFHEHPNAFLWGRMIKDPDGRLPRGISGRIAVTAKTFLLSGGYDEKYNDWGPDDKDFNFRVRRLGLDPVEIDRRFLLAMLHNDKMRFREYPHAAQAAGEDGLFDQPGKSESTIANWGRFGLGTVYRNYGTLPLELRPLPTRLFGIGLHKTATLSLHHAFGILGYDSAHWENAHWAKTIWTEMQSTGRSLTLERHYALSDLPIPMLYPKLDRAYPGSKFILTVRDEKNWLRSVQDHFDPQRNRFRAQWDHDPFSNRVHLELYGRRKFDADIFLARYRRHNAEVREYFKDRPNDLLLMDMDAGAGWRELCGFLEVPVPSVPYPVTGRSRAV